MTPLGLYLHVPFCRNKCAYCDFYSTTDFGLQPAWLERTLSILERDCPFPDAQWDTVYIGGGTPSLLRPEAWERLLAAVASRRAPQAEFTVEANPESLTAEHLAVWAAGGVSRLSLGIQSFQDSILARVGRPTRLQDLRRAQRLVADWPGQLALDLICGLPGQTAAGQARDLEQALDWGSDHLSWYALCLEAQTPLAAEVNANRRLLAGESTLHRWWQAGRDRLATAGYEPYEVSNFARPGRECRHNQGYWNLRPWWGIGPSASSFFESSASGPVYQHYSPQLAAYVRGDPPLIEALSARELAKDRLLAGLRQSTGIPLANWRRWIGQTLDHWQEALVPSEERLMLNQKGLRLLNTFLIEAFAELDQAPVQLDLS